MKLNQRETEVLRLLSLGYPMKAISIKMSISLGTVWNYAQSARNKLGACSSTQAVRMAIENGFIEVDIHHDEFSNFA
jgi:two-component system response regulator DesR